MSTATFCGVCESHDETLRSAVRYAEHRHQQGLIVNTAALDRIKANRTKHRQIAHPAVDAR